MRFAETGYNLEIDLSRGSIDRVQTDPRLTELHLGGQGTAGKILWDRVPPEIEPFSPDNLLIFSPGLLVSTPVPGANRTIVNTISPQTDRYSHSILGGNFGPELKHAGYDKIVIRGKSPSLVYLWIHNDKVEICDARHLRGRGALETGMLIQKELNEPTAQVAAIGLAGENRVYMATVEHTNGTAGRGVGVIMGDKRLKAIAVRGTKDINIAKPVELFEICKRMYQEIYDNRHCGDIAVEHDDDYSWHLNNFAWGNARGRNPGFWNTEVQKKWRAITKSVRLRFVACNNCPKNCRQVISYPGRQPYTLKCFGKLIYVLASYEGLDFAYDILGLSSDYGLDCMSTPQIVAFALELLKAGILGDKDFPGMPSDNRGRFFYLIEKIARREGIGDILANGVYHAARHIGNGAEEYDHNTIKKFEQVPIKLGMINYAYYLMYATGEKMVINQIEGSYPQAAIADKKERENFVANWEAAPERFKKWYLEWEPREHPSIEASVNIADWNETMHYIDDAIGMCAFLSSWRGQFGGRPPYHIYNLPKFISLATGMDIDSATLWEISRRNRNLIRAINVRRGLRRGDEAPPVDHWKKRDNKMEQEHLSEYYRFKGWNNEGIPTKETLDKLGLNYVSEDLFQRGIFSDNTNTSSLSGSKNKV